MKKPRIGIIGQDGKYGRFWTRHFEGHRLDVIGSDRRTPLFNQEVVEQSDVVIFAVSLKMMAGVIHSVAPFARSEQLWIETCSVKSRSIRVLEFVPASVVGLHFMCSPPTRDFTGQNLIVCVERLSETWKAWLSEFLSQTKATVNYRQWTEHDGRAVFTQPLPHSMALATAMTLMASKVEAKELEAFDTPFSRGSTTLISRLLSQDPELVADLALENETFPAVLATAVAQLERISQCVRSGNRQELIKLLGDAKTYFGEDKVRSGNESFIRMVKEIR